MCVRRCTAPIMAEEAEGKEVPIPLADLCALPIRLGHR
jgi:hypothetical protein